MKGDGTRRPPLPMFKKLTLKMKEDQKRVRYVRRDLTPVNSAQCCPRRCRACGLGDNDIQVTSTAVSNNSAEEYAAADRTNPLW